MKGSKEEKLPSEERLNENEPKQIKSLMGVYSHLRNLEGEFVVRMSMWRRKNDGRKLQREDKDKTKMCRKEKTQKIKMNYQKM